MTRRVEQLSEQLAVLMGQHPLIASEDFEAALDRDGAEFYAASASRPNKAYPMTWTPEGFAVHVDEGCEAERFRGINECPHFKDYTRRDAMTQALVRAESVLTPAPIEFNREQLDLIKNTIAKGATDQELSLFVATCRRTGLDPFMRQIYCVKRWDSAQGKEAMAIQVGIDGLRLIAERTGRYGGQDAITWLDVNGQWAEVWTGEGAHPVAARCTVYRTDAPRGFPAVARWDSYAQFFGKEHKLSATWAKMPDVMLAKCAESLALRRAFPAEMSGIAAAIDNEYDPGADTEVAQAAAYADAIEGSVVQAPPAPPKPEPAPKAPTDLLNAISKAHGAAVAAKARGIMPYLYQTGDVLKLTRDDRDDYIEKLTVWLNDPDHEHTPAYASDGRAVCGRCGVEVVEEPEDDFDIDAETSQGQQAELMTSRGE